MIAKALAHEPQILFLDEPTAGVDVELRRGMWALMRRLRENGMTIILTTHYIEEAEEMADRVGVIHKGKLLLAQEKATLMRKLGKKRLEIVLQSPLSSLPRELAELGMKLEAQGAELCYTFDSSDESINIPALLARLSSLGIGFKDIQTNKSSLEDIFVSLVSDQASLAPPEPLPDTPARGDAPAARAQSGAAP